MPIMRRVLVVDDDPHIRNFMKLVLEKDHFQALEAESGVHAFQIVERIDGQLDVIVTDVQMPEGSGLTLAWAVRATFPHIAILLVSGRAQPESDFAFLEKPFSSAELIRSVRGLVYPEAKTA